MCSKWGLYYGTRYVYVCVCMTVVVGEMCLLTRQRPIGQCCVIVTDVVVVMKWEWSHFCILSKDITNHLTQFRLYWHNIWLWGQLCSSGPCSLSDNSILHIHKSKQSPVIHCYGSCQTESHKTQQRCKWPCGKSYVPSWRSPGQTQGRLAASLLRLVCTYSSVGLETYEQQQLL